MPDRCSFTDFNIFVNKGRLMNKIGLLGFGGNRFRNDRSNG